MADPKGFLTTGREGPKRRPVDVRIRDWREVYEPFPTETLEKQAGRCMDCGIPFCHNGCPLGNLIPEWNDLVWREDWRAASERLHATNNFPEFTGRLCPAPCETACVLGINQDPVSIKQVEVEIVDRAWDEGWVTPQPAPRQSGKTVAVVGSQSYMHYHADYNTGTNTIYAGGARESYLLLPVIPVKNDNVIRLDHLCSIARGPVALRLAR